MKTIVFPIATLFCSASLLGTSPQPEPFGQDESKLEIRNREKQGVGYEEGYTTFEYQYTKNWQNPLLLLNLRAHLFNDARLATNIGLGVRQSFNNDRLLCGFNLFYDFRESKYLLSQQVGGGLEFLNPRWDFRINGYFPFSDQVHCHGRFTQFSGNTVVTDQKIYQVLPSVDMELGVSVAPFCYMAAGSYYLFGENSRHLHFGDAVGGKFRISFDMGPYVYAGSDATFDSIFHTRVQGYLGIRIPLGKHDLKKNVRKVLRKAPIVRNEIIPIQKKKKTAVLTLDWEEKDPVQVVFVNNTAQEGGNGSFETPFSSLKEAEKESVPGNIIYVFPGDGTARNMNEGIVLQDGQILASSSASLTVAEVIIPALTPDQVPVLTNIHSGEPVVTNPGHSKLDGFSFIEPWRYLRDYHSPVHLDISKPAWIHPEAPTLPIDGINQNDSNRVDYHDSDSDEEGPDILGKPEQQLPESPHLSDQFDSGSDGSGSPVGPPPSHSRSASDSFERIELPIDSFVDLGKE